ncbi:UDP-glucuronosyltransferase [Rhyzopertha dominica]|nr:UDP-glucuronosyltransferase [Rhyzopertha dominica]
MSVSTNLLLFLFVGTAQSAKILCVFPTASISHQIAYQPIWRELSLRGHEVVSVTTNPLNDPTLTNLTEIDISYLYDHTRSIMAHITSEKNHWYFIDAVLTFQGAFFEQMFRNPQLVAMLNDSNVSFDLVVAEFLSPLVTAFAYKYNCPFVGTASLELFTTVHEAVGNPVHPLLHPDLMSTFGEELTFLEKVEAVLYAAVIRLKHHYQHVPIYNGLVKKYLGDDVPSVAELERNASIVFTTTHPILHGARAYSPGVIEVGRMHIREKEPLPEGDLLSKDLQDFLDNAEEGVIYFSLGSNVRSANIDSEKRTMIMEAFGELPYKVLWKFEEDALPNKPSNVKISKWLPQQDLLGHRNIKLFITQTGLQSTEEAIANETPMLAIPFAFDQFNLAKKVTKLGIGLNLDFSKLTKESFKAAIIEITDNPKYKKKIREINDLLTDRPMTGLETTMWWIEYVLRHKGAPYFRNRVVDMPWYEYFLLDVMGYLIVSGLLFAAIAYKLVKLFLEKIGVYTGLKKLKTA